MPLVKVIRNGQITIPKELRSALSIEEGDLLEVELSNRGLYMKPKSVVDKDLAKDSFFQTMEKLRENTKGVDPEKLNAAITEAVQSAKRTTARKRKARADA
jgi:AbrB family looped-hinge helix DNA binding protein